jgi:hypothetical protein
MHMAFCGQCGFQLRAGDMACPRCGMVTEPMLVEDSTDATNADSPTIASNMSTLPAPGLAWQVQTPTRQNTPPQPQQPLIFRPIDSSPVTDAPNYPGANASYPGFAAPTQGTSYPGYAPQSHPGAATPGGFDTAPGDDPRKRGRGLLVTLVVLFTLALAGSFTWYFLYGRPPTPVNTPIPTATSAPTPALTPTLTPAQQAQLVVQQYYDDINNRNYQAAYSLLGTADQGTQPYGKFSSGYAHTRHDIITFNSIAPQNDGTVVVTITIQATEDATSGTGTQLNTYHVSYVVGQENGAWKILSGHSA